MPKRPFPPIVLTRRQPTGLRMMDGTVLLDPPSLPKGSSGGRFSSTSHFKQIKLPSIYSPYGMGLRGTRAQSISTGRYVVVPPMPDEAMAEVPPRPLTVDVRGDASLTRRWDEEVTSLNRAQLLKAQARVHAPHRAKKSYMLCGNTVLLQSRRDMEEQELLRLEKLGLRPAPELYFGRGFGNEPRSVRLRQLQRAMSPTAAAEAESAAAEAGSAPPVALNEEPEPAPPVRLPQAEDTGSAAAADDAAAPGDAAEALSGWEGTVMEGGDSAPASLKQQLRERLARHESGGDAAAQAEFETRELQRAADDAQTTRLNDSFMALDLESASELPPDTLRAAIGDEHSADVVKAIELLVGPERFAKPAQLPTFVGLTSLATLMSGAGAPEQALAAFNADDASASIAAMVRDLFFLASSQADGAVTVEHARSLLFSGRGDAGDSVWAAFAADQGAEVRLPALLAALPRLLLGAADDDPQG